MYLTQNDIIIVKKLQSIAKKANESKPLPKEIIKADKIKLKIHKN